MYETYFYICNIYIYILLLYIIYYIYAYSVDKSRFINRMLLYPQHECTFLGCSDDLFVVNENPRLF